MIIRNFKAAARRKEKRKSKGQDTSKGPAHQPAHISFLAYHVTYQRRKKWEQGLEISQV
jgi:hypothetical protein